MPRRPQRERELPPSRAEQLADLQDSDLRQQQFDTAQNTALLDQLNLLYGISSRAQMMPEELRHLGLSNDQLSLQNSWLGPHLTQEWQEHDQAMRLAAATGQREEEMQPYRVLEAQSGIESHDAARNLATQQAHNEAEMFPLQKRNIESEITHRDRASDIAEGRSITLPGMLQIHQLFPDGNIPPELQAYMDSHASPEMREAMAQGRAAQNQKRWAQMEGLAHAGGIPMAMRPQVSQEYGDQNLAYLDTLSQAAIPEALRGIIPPEYAGDPVVQQRLHEFIQQQQDPSAAPADPRLRQVRQQLLQRIHPGQAFFQDLFSRPIAPNSVAPILFPGLSY